MHSLDKPTDKDGELRFECRFEQPILSNCENVGEKTLHAGCEFSAEALDIRQKILNISTRFQM